MGKILKSQQSLHAQSYVQVRHRIAGMLLLSWLAGSGLVVAEPKAAAPGGEAIKKAQGLIRQLSQEKAALEAEKSAWSTEKAALDGKVKSLEAAIARLQPLQAEVERYKSGLEAVRSNLESQLGQQRQREQALLQKHNEVVNKARDIRDDNNLLVKAVQEREEWIKQCGSVNQQLRGVNAEIVKHYRDKGFLQQFAELDVVTGIGQVETEAVAEEYRYKLQQLKITPFEGSVPVPQSDTAEQASIESGAPLMLPSDATGNADKREKMHPNVGDTGQ